MCDRRYFTRAVFTRWIDCFYDYFYRRKFGPFDNRSYVFKLYGVNGFPAFRRTRYVPCFIVRIASLFAWHVVGWGVISYKDNGRRARSRTVNAVLIG